MYSLFFALFVFVLAKENILSYGVASWAIDAITGKDLEGTFMRSFNESDSLVNFCTAFRKYPYQAVYIVFSPLLGC